MEVKWNWNIRLTDLDVGFGPQNDQFVGLFVACGSSPWKSGNE